MSAVASVREDRSNRDAALKGMYPGGQVLTQDGTYP